MEELIIKVFDAYCLSYAKVLSVNGFEPWMDKRKSIHESNQVRTFLEAYKATGEDIITWMELPIVLNGGNAKDGVAHIDGFIVDNDRKYIIFIEAKRFSHERQFKSLNADVHRLYSIRKIIHDGIGQFKGLNLIDYEAYVLFLADIWEHRCPWVKDLAANWDDHSNDLDCSPEQVMKKGIREIIPSYHLTYTLAPFFKAEENE